MKSECHKTIGTLDKPKEAREYSAYFFLEQLVIPRALERKLIPRMPNVRSFLHSLFFMVHNCINDMAHHKYHLDAECIYISLQYKFESSHGIVSDENLSCSSS